jgi:hypothetical protein
MLMVVLMLGILLAGIGVFVWLWFSVLKEKIVLEENQAVPITDVKGFKTAHLPPGVKREGAVLETQSVPEPSSAQAIALEPVKDRPVEQRAQVVGDVQEAETVRQLNEEIKLIREKAVIQAKNAIEMINKLREENEQLRLDVEKSEERSNKPIADEDLLTHLRAENIAFKEQLSCATQEAEELRQKLAQAGQGGSAQLAGGPEAVQRLEAENAELRLKVSSFSQAEPAAGDVHEQCHNQISLLASEIETMRKDNEKLRSAMAAKEAAASQEIDPDQGSTERELEELRKRADDLEKLSRSLDENGRYLQYELTKSRAQVAGLERICENSSKQFEEIARGAREAQQNNQALKVQTRVLEQSLTDFKKLNAELVKREKLTQFEMERNLDQIRNLEDIYGVFRSRLARLGISEEELVKD